MLENSTYFLYHKFGSHILFIEPKGTSLYLGDGFPSLSSKVQDFIIIQEDLLSPIFSSSSRVEQLGPDALNTGFLNSIHAMFVLIIDFKVNYKKYFLFFPLLGKSILR
jgi:hypothetical protein